MFIIPFYGGTHFFKFLTQAVCPSGLKQKEYKRLLKFELEIKRGALDQHFCPFMQMIWVWTLDMNYCNDLAIISPSLLKYR